MTWMTLVTAMTGLGPALVAGEEDAGGHADGDGEQDGEEGEPEVLEGEAADLGGVEMEEVHAGCAGSGLARLRWTAATYCWT